MMIYTHTAAGRSHVVGGVGNQDHAVVLRGVTKDQDNEIVVAGVSDGASTSELADRASRSAATTGARFAAAGVDARRGRSSLSAALAVRCAFVAALNALLSLASSCGADVNDVLCTLMIVVYEPRTRLVHWGYVGDGTVVCMSDDGRCWIPRGCEQQRVEGEGSNVTRFLTDTGHWRFGAEHDCSAIAVMTDGLANTLVGVSEDGHDAPLRECFEIMDGFSRVSMDGGDIDRLIANDESVTDDVSLVIVSDGRAAHAHGGRSAGSRGKDGDGEDVETRDTLPLPARGRRSGGR